MYLVRKRFGWFGRVRVTAEDTRGDDRSDNPERWRASFRYIWDADAFVNALCDGVTYTAVDSDYFKPINAK